MESFFQEGLIDNVTVDYTESGELQYYRNGSPISSYDKYGEALRRGSEEQLLFAQNGIALKRNSPIGRQYYVVDYQWLPKGRYDKQDIIDYTQNNRWLMFMRSAYLTDSVLYGTVLFITLYGLSHYIMPIMLTLLANSYIVYKKHKSKSRDIDYEYSDLAKSMLIKLLDNRYSKAWDVPIMVGILSYFITSTSVVNTIFLGRSDSHIIIALMYIVLLLVLSAHYLHQVYLDIDFKRLEKKMLNEKNDNTEG